MFSASPSTGPPKQINTRIDGCNCFIKSPMGESRSLGPKSHRSRICEPSFQSAPPPLQSAPSESGAPSPCLPPPCPPLHLDLCLCLQCPFCLPVSLNLCLRLIPPPHVSVFPSTSLSSLSLSPRSPSFPPCICPIPVSPLSPSVSLSLSPASLLTLLPLHHPLQPAQGPRWWDIHATVPASTGPWQLLEFYATLPTL